MERTIDIDIKDEKEMITSVIEQTLNASVCGFTKWYMDDFETDECFENKEELMKLDATSYECAMNDWFYWVADGYLGLIYDTLGYDKYEDGNNFYSEFIYETLREKIFDRIDFRFRGGKNYDK